MKTHFIEFMKDMGAYNKYCALLKTKTTLSFEEYFLDDASAEQQLRDLPIGLSPKSQVLSLWDENTVYFADPFVASKEAEKSRIKSSAKYTPPLIREME